MQPLDIQLSSDKIMGPIMIRRIARNRKLLENLIIRSMTNNCNSQYTTDPHGSLALVGGTGHATAG